MPNYLKLYTPQDSAVVFIDHQPQMLFGVSNIDRSLLINNVALLAKVASEFKVPVAPSRRCSNGSATGPGVSTTMR